MLAGCQLDADMIVGKYCDRLFDATEKEVTPQYPYPIMPVHWMTRYVSRKRAVIFFGWVFFLFSSGSPHVRCTPMGRTCGEPDSKMKSS